MKKFTAILLTVIMVTSLFISCDNSMAPTVTDETVSVSFTETTSRSLTASLENFDQTKYWWAYAAQKADNTNLKSGETANYGNEGEEQVWIKGNPNTNSMGLGSVGGFSQGLWNFKLFAYKEKSSTDLTPVIAYQGEIKNVSLTKGSDNKVVVTVSPISTGTGKLKINDSISLKNFEENVTATNLTKEYTVTALNSTVAISPTNPSGDEWEDLPVGAYKVTVEFKRDSITYGSGSVVATVYSNLTTEVSGFLKELVTNADFNSDINPDVINKEASSDSIDYGTLTSTEPPAPTIVTLSEDTSKISASVPASAVKEVIKNITGTNTPNNNTSIELALRVDTIDATNTTLKLEIGMQATVTEKDAANKVVRQISNAVSNLDDIVTVTVQLQAGLENVQVYHNNSENPMNSLTSAEQNAEGVFSNSTNAKLTIKTRSFSPFEIRYKEPKFVAKIGNVKYTYLQRAINAIPSNTESTVIEILSNIDLVETVNISGKGPIEIKLNGNVITGIGKRALLVQDGELTISGPGTITVSQGIEDFSSVIRVAGTNEREAKLTIGADVTISSDYSYGITVFGPNKQTLIVNGSVKTKNVPAISGNGSAGFGETDITINGNVETINENAIYHPQAGNLSINGSVKGLGGIEAKSGTTVSLGENARVEATATSVSHDPNSNGCSTSGYAIVAVENSAYKGNPKFNISGGTYIGPIAIIYDDNNVEDSKKASISITGGKFTFDPAEFYSILYKAVQEGLYWNVAKITNNSENDPIRIKNESDWLLVANKAYYSSGTQGLYYKVEKDLDFTGVTKPVGFRYFAGHIDFQGHTISGLNGSNTYTYRYPSLFKYVKAGASIKNLVFELPNLGTDYTVKPIGAIEGTGSVTLENIAISGNLNMTDNNTGLLVDFIGGYYAFEGTLNLIGCTSTCNMVNSGYASAFIGGIYYGGNQITLNATNCVNYGKIISTGAAASMLISNGTRHTGDYLTLNIENCKNEGQIIAAPGKSIYLAMPDMGSEAIFYTAEEIRAYESSGKIVNANGGFTASLTAGTLTVVDGNFDLLAAMDKVQNATRFELVFGFQGTGGLGAGGVTQYSFKFDSRDSVVNVPAYRWVNMSNASGVVTEHNAYGTTYYTDNNGHYVYNTPGYTMSSQPKVSFVAYDSDNNVKLVDFYSYTN